MSEAIPQTDAALLEAQARAGQAGVLAYEAAKREMTANRQQATSSALTAAAARGAPQGAMESALGVTNQMYDRRDAALATAQAAYEDAMASRAARMGDYSAGVNEARGLIDAQAQQAIAPIDAQTRYAVARIEAQGQQNVDQIEAQRRLKELEMQAAFEEAQRAAASRGSSGGGGGGGGGGGTSTNKGELAALIGNQSGQYVEQAVAQAQGVLDRNRIRQAPQRQTSSIQSFRSMERADQAKRDAAKLPTGTDLYQQIQGKAPSTPAAQASAADAVKLAMQRAATANTQRVDQNERFQAETTRDLGTLATDPNNRLGAILAAAMASGQPLMSSTDLQRAIGGYDEYSITTPYVQSLMDQGRRQATPTDRDAATEAMRQAYLLAGQDSLDAGYDFNSAEFLDALSDTSLEGMTYADRRGLTSGVGTTEDQRDRAQSEADAWEADLRQQFNDDLAADKREIDAGNAQLERDREEDNTRFFEMYGTDIDSVGVPIEVLDRVINTEGFEDRLAAAELLVGVAGGDLATPASVREELLNGGFSPYSLDNSEEQRVRALADQVIMRIILGRFGG